MAEITETKADLLRVANDINTEGWAETIAGILFEDEEMKASGNRKRAISYEMRACLNGDVIAASL